MRRPWLDVLKGACIWLVVMNHAMLWPMRAGDCTAAFLYGTAFGTVAAFAAVAGFLSGLHPPGSTGTLLRKRAGQPGGCAALALAVGATREPSWLSRALGCVGAVSLGAYVLHPIVVGPGMLLVPARYGVPGALLVIALGVPLVAALARWAQGVRILRAFV